MPTSTHQGDLYVNGNLAAKTQTIAAAAVGNPQVASAANIDGTKLQHFHRGMYENESATTAVSEARVVHHCLNTGTITDFWAGSVVLNVGAATITVDLKKNGASILTAPITLNSANVARVAVQGTIASPGVVANDVLEVVITATAGGGTLGKGVFASVNVHEQSTG